MKKKIKTYYEVALDKYLVREFEKQKKCTHPAFIKKCSCCGIILETEKTNEENKVTIVL